MTETTPGGSTGDATTASGLAFLAAAGELLAGSLDYAQTLQRVAQLSVPQLGDLCIVDVVDGGRLRRVATAHVLPAKAALLEELARWLPAPGGSPAPAGRALASGRTELLEQVTPEVVAAHTVDAEHARLIREIGVRSHVAVPMSARGQIVGVISLGISESARRYGAAEVALVEELARRAALAVDNARLYQAARDELAERQRVEAALRLSESRFRAIMEQSPLSTQLLAPSGHTIAVNQAWRDLWGLSAADISDYSVLADPQLESSGIAALLRRAFAGEAVRLPEIAYDTSERLPEHSDRTATTRWVAAFAYPVRDAQGAVCEVVLVHEDVSAARGAAEQLRSSEERLRRALSGSRTCVWDWDLERDIVECSENAVEIWGRRVGSAADFLSLVHPEDSAELDRAATRAMAGEPYSAEYRSRRPDGGYQWLQSRGQLQRDASGRPLRLLGITHDVSERRHAEEAARVLADAGEVLGTSLDYHATLRQLARVVVPRLADWCALDLLTPAGALERVTVNHSDPARVALATEIFRRYPPRRGDVGSVWQVIDSGEPECVPEIPEGLLAERAIDADHLALLQGLGLKSFIRVPLKARGAALGVLTLVQAESGRHYAAHDVALAADLARRAATAVENARLYEQLQREDRRKDEFLATLAHELRNPLAPIRNGLAVLQSAPDAQVAERTRAIMDRQLGHMVRLIDDLLDLSRVTRGTVELRREQVELRAVIDSALEAVRPLLQGNGLELSLEIPPHSVLLWADHTRLAQVVTNLLNNAAKFTPRGGSIELLIREQGGDLLIQVSDSGIGIEPAMLRQIFDLFVRAGDGGPHGLGGLGIGLTLVRRLVELHGGQVWAESAGSGQGSRFNVRLPTARSVPPAGERADSQAVAPTESPRRRQRVLVVDDNEDAAETLAVLLALEGHDVRTASSGAAALAIVDGFHPGVAFLDIGLPGMSGYELAQRLRANPALAGTMLVALTGWGREEDRRRSREAGFDHHLTKPVNPEEVMALAGGEGAGAEPGGARV